MKRPFTYLLLLAIVAAAGWWWQVRVGTIQPLRAEFDFTERPRPLGLDELSPSPVRLNENAQAPQQDAVTDFSRSGQRQGDKVEIYTLERPGQRATLYWRADQVEVQNNPTGVVLTAEAGRLSVQTLLDHTKTSLTRESAADADSFEFELKVAAGTAELDAAGRVGLRSEGNTWGYLPAPVAQDAAGQSVPYRYELIELSDNSYLLRLRPNGRAAEPLAYPVVIDPTIAWGFDLSEQYIVSDPALIQVSGGKVALLDGGSGYSTNNPYVQTASGQLYTDLIGLDVGLGAGNQGAVSFQLSPNGSVWYWWNGSSWAAGSGYDESSSAADIDAHLGTFTSQVGTGSLFFRAYLHASSSSTPVELDFVSIEYLTAVDRTPTIATLSPESVFINEETSLTITGTNFVGPYRREVTVTNTTASALSDHPVLVAFDSSTAVTDGKLQSDGRDLRVYDSDGITPLPYWIESGVGTATTKVWVKLPALAASGQRTISLMYGSGSTAVAQSSGSAVFPFFDDFNDGSLDTSIWTTHNGGTITEANGVLTVQAPGGTDWSGTADNAPYVLNKLPLGNSFIAETMLASASTACWQRYAGLRGGSAANSQMYVLLKGNGSDTQANWRDVVGGSTGGVLGFDNTYGWTNLPIKFLKDGNSVTGYMHNISYGSHTAAGYDLQYLALTDISCASDASPNSFDWALARPYIGSEPTVEVAPEQGVSVQLGGTTLPLTSISATEIVATVLPQETGGVVDVSVTNAFGLSVVRPAGFTYDANLPEPSLTSAVPNSGYTRGDTVVTLSGHNFGAKYRRVVSVTNGGASSLTNYQTFLTLDTATLIGMGKMRSDGSDIRFYDQDGTPLSYYIESGLNTNSTKIWFKIPSLAPGETRDISLRYNAGVLPQSNAAAVFDVYDDFDGSSLDTGKWEILNPANGTVSVANSRLSLSTSGDIWNTNDTATMVVLKQAQGSSYIAETKAATLAPNGYDRYFQLRSSTSTNAASYGMLYDGDRSHITTLWRDAVGGGTDWAGENTGAAATAHSNVELRLVSNGTTATAFLAGVQAGTRTVTGWSLQHPAFIDMYIAGGSSFDWFRVRRYAATEPTIQVGNELAPTVTFGGLEASILSTADNEMVVQTPPHAPATVDVVLTTTTGQTTTLAGGYTYVSPPAPTLSSLDPSSGLERGGKAVTITGTGFMADYDGAPATLGVSFGGVSASSVTWVSETTLRAVTPPHAVGLVDVVVTNPDGQTGALGGGFTYTEPPQLGLTSVDPVRGALAGGETVTVTGENFSATYLRTLTITNSDSNPVINRPVQLTLDTEALVAAGKLQADGDDLRFFDVDGVTPLSYWIESGLNTATTKVWVNIPNIGAQTSDTFYMGYGDPQAAGQSSQSATWPSFADAFDDGNYTSSPTWTVSSGSWDIVSKYLHVAGGGAISTPVNQNMGDGFSFSFKHYLGAWGGAGVDFDLFFGSLTSGGNQYSYRSEDLGGYSWRQGLYKDGTWLLSRTVGGSINQWIQVDITRSSAGLWEVKIDGVSLGTVTDTTYTVGSYVVIKPQHTQNMYFDELRSWIPGSSEPTVVVGATETDTALTFGAVPATDVVIRGPSSLTAVVPAGSATGPVSLTLTSSDGQEDTLFNAYTYYPDKYLMSPIADSVQQNEPIQLTLTARDAAGNAVVAPEPIEFSLSSSSTSGAFAWSLSDPSAVRWTRTSVTLPAGASSVSFYYRDGLQGTAAITAAPPSNSGVVENQSTLTVTSKYRLMITGLTTSLKAGYPSSLTVVAVDYQGQTLSDYTGTVTFSSSDVGAVVPANFTFTPQMLGSRTFVNGFTPVTQGSWCLTVTDTLDSNITGEVCDIEVSAPDAGTISKLRFITPAQSVSADGSSSAITVQTQDLNDTPINVSESTAIYIYGTSATAEYSSNGQSGWAGGDPYVLMISAGANSGTFYYRDSVPGQATLTAREDEGVGPNVGWENDDQAVAVVTGSAYRLRMVPALPTVTAGESLSLTARLEDAAGNVLTATQPQPLALSSNSETGEFSLDGVSWSSTLVSSIAAGYSSQTIYYRDTRSGGPTLTLSESSPADGDAGLIDGSAVVTVTAATPTSLALANLPASLEAGQVSGVMNVQLVDAYGNVAESLGDTALSVTVTDSAGRLSATDSGFSASSLNLTIPAGQTAASFYYRNLNQAEETITATSSGLSSGGGSFTVIWGDPVAVSLTGPTEIVAGATASLQLQLLNAHGVSVPAGETRTVTISSSTPGTSLDTSSGGSFASDSATSTWGANDTEATVYSRSTAAGTVNFTASSTGLSEGSLVATLTAASPVAIHLEDWSATLEQGATELATLRLRDSYGNLAAAAGPLTLYLGATSETGEFLDADLQPVEQYAVAAGSSSTTLRYRDVTVGLVTVTVTDQTDVPDTGLTDDQAVVEITPGAPTSLRLTPATSTPSAGAATAVQLQVENDYGVPARVVADLVVELSDSSTTGGFGLQAEGPFTATEVTVPALSSGVTIYYRDTAAANVTLGAAANGYQSAGSGLVIGSAEPAQITFLSSSPTLARREASGPLTIQLTDVFGNVALSDGVLVVNLSSGSGEGEFATSASGPWNVTQLTPLAGQSTATFYYRDDRPGITTLTAQSDGLTADNLSVTIEGDVATSLSLTPDNLTVTAGVPSGALTVTALREDGIAARLADDLIVALSTDEATGRLAATASAEAPALQAVTIPAASSSVSFYYVGERVGSYTVSVTAEAVAGDDSAVTVNSGDAYQLAWLSQPQTVPAGQVSGEFRVQLQDEFGNVATAADSLSVALTTTSSEGGFSVTADPWNATGAITLSAGTSDLYFYYQDTSTGTPTLTASAVGLVSSTQQASITAATISRLVVTPGSLSGQAGEVLGPLTVRFYDEFSNQLAAPSEMTLHLASSATSGSFSQDNTFSSPVNQLTVAAGASAATFYYRDTTAGSPWLTVADQAEGTDVGAEDATVNVAVAWGAVTQLSLSGGSGIAGVATSLQLQRQNQYGLPVPSSSAQEVWLSSDGDGSFTDSTVTIPGGASSVAVEYVGRTAGTDILTASDQSSPPELPDSGLVNGTLSFAVLSGEAAQLKISGLPTTLTAGETRLLSVGVFDTFGNVALTASDLTLYLSASRGELAADENFAEPLDQLVIPAGQSAYTFYYRSLSTGATALIVRDTELGEDTALVDAQQLATVVTGTPDHVVVSVSTGSGLVGGVIGPISITATNPHGVTAAVESDITINLSSTSETGSFASSSSGPWNLTAAVITAGESVANIYYRDTSAGTYTLTAESGELQGDSLEIIVTAGLATQLAVVNPPESVTVRHPSSPIEIELRNQYGYPVVATQDSVVRLVTTSSEGEFALSSAGAWGITQVTIPAGQSGVNVYYRDLTEGQVTITADGPTGLIDASFALSVERQVLHHLEVTSITDPLYQGWPSSVVVMARDEAGYIVDWYDGTVSFSSSDPAARLPQSYTFQPGDFGIHQFVNAVAFSQSGEYSVTVTDETGLTGSQTGITVQANTFGQPTALQMLPDEELIVRQHGAPARLLTVALLDAGGNAARAPSGGYTVHLSAGAGGELAAAAAGPWSNSLELVIPEGFSSVNYLYRSTEAANVVVTATDWSGGFDDPGITNDSLTVRSTELSVSITPTVTVTDARGLNRSSASVWPRNEAGSYLSAASFDLAVTDAVTGEAVAADWSLSWHGIDGTVIDSASAVDATNHHFDAGALTGTDSSGAYTLTVEVSAGEITGTATATLPLTGWRAELGYVSDTVIPGEGVSFELRAYQSGEAAEPTAVKVWWRATDGSSVGSTVLSLSQLTEVAAGIYQGVAPTVGFTAGTAYLTAQLLTAPSGSVLAEDEGTAVTFTAPPPATSFVWEVSPTVVNGSALTLATLTATDQFGNPVTDFSAAETPVTLTLNPGTAALSRGGSPSVTLNTPTDFVDGVAHLDGELTLTGTAGSYTLTASSGSLIGVSEDILLQAGDPVVAKIVTSDGPAHQEVGTLFLTPEQAVTMWSAGYDQSGNYTGVVAGSWAVTGSLTGLSGTTGNSVTLAPTTAPESGTVTFAADELVDTTGQIMVTSTIADHLEITAPSLVTAGDETSVTVRAVTSSGGLVDDYTITQPASWSGAANSPLGDEPIWAESLVFTRGVATANLRLFRAESLRLNLQVAHLSGQSSQITVEPAADHHLTATLPATAVVGVPVTITDLSVKDQYGNLSQISGEQLLRVSPQGGLVSTAVTAPSSLIFTSGLAESWQATFSTAGTGALEIEAFGVTGVTTEVEVGDPLTAEVVVVSGDGQSGQAGEWLDQPVRVLVRRTGSAPLAGVTVHFTALQGEVESSTVTTDTTGEAETRWRLGATAGSHRLAVAVAGIESALSLTATARAGDVALLSWSPTVSQQRRSQRGGDLLLCAYDAAGNVAAGSSRTLQLSSTSLQGRFFLSGTDNAVTSVPLSMTTGCAALAYQDSWIGSATLTATDGQLSAQHQVNVLSPIYTNISITPSPVVGSMGETIPLQAYALTEGGERDAVIPMWSAVAGGTMSPDGRFTFGREPGRYPHGVTAQWNEWQAVADVVVEADSDLPASTSSQPIPLTEPGALTTRQQVIIINSGAGVSVARNALIIPVIDLPRPDTLQGGAVIAVQGRAPAGVTVRVSAETGRLVGATVSNPQGRWQLFLDRDQLGGPRVVLTPSLINGTAGPATNFYLKQPTWRDRWYNLIK